MLLTFGNSVCFYWQRLFTKYFHSQIMSEKPVCFSKATIIVYGCILLQSQIFNYRKQTHSE
jgi:hypothetical protein